jgi:cytochrome c-type biogenesis protein CcmH
MKLPTLDFKIKKYKTLALRRTRRGAMVVLWPLFLCVLCVKTMSFASTADAQTTSRDSILEAKARDVASQLRCPVCQGLSIQDSPSELAVQMKQVVRDQLKGGKSPDEIKAYFVSKYGEWVLLEPPARGFNLAVYLAPLAMLLAGAGLIVVTVRKWTRQPQA